MKQFHSALLIILIFFGFLFHANSQDYWQQTNGPYTSSPYGGYLYSTVINSDGKIFTGAYGNGIFRSTDNGVTWIEINNGLSNLLIRAMVINSSDHLFAASYGGGIFRSTNNGDTWEPINNGLTKMFAVSLAINSLGHIFAGTWDGGVFRSTDNGNNWTKTNLPNIGVISLAINSNNYIFAGSYGCDGVYLSTDNGDTWTQKNNGLTECEIKALAIDSNNIVYAGSASVFVSTNNGDNWTKTNLTYVHDRALVVNADNYVFAGTYGSGVYYSTDYGTNWTAINNGLTYLYVYSLAINLDGFIFAGTHSGTWGGIVFRSINSTTTYISEGTSLLPELFTLKQNYPNPFNPSTAISYQLPVSSDVTLKVFDILGSEVETLVDEYKTAGRYEVEFKTASGNRNLSSGVYFYQLRAENFIQTRKMILIK